MQVATNAETTQQEETKQVKQEETKEIKQEPREEPKQEKFQEDLTLPERVLDIEVIKDWPARFEAADYSQEQRDLVGLCLKNRDVWLQMHSATDWKAHHSDKEIEIFTREGPRKILQMKAFGILPFTPLQVFRLLADSE